MTRYTLIFAIILGCVISATVSAQDPIPSNTASSDTKPASATPPLFKITDEDTEIFLLGTFHFQPKDFNWRSKEINNVIDRAETIWVEVESDSINFGNTAKKIVEEKGSNPDGVSLTSLLDEKSGLRFSAILESLNIPTDALDAMRPWQGFLALSSQLIASEGYNPASGIDANILREARLRQRNINFLETAEEQLSLFTELDSQTEIALLQLTINNWAKQKDQLTLLLNAWITGDLEKIDTLMNDVLRKNAPAVYQRLITDRNHRWAEKISTLLEEPGVILVAVGTGHLVGEGSLPALLQGANLNIKPIKFEVPNIANTASQREINRLPKGALEKLFPTIAKEKIRTETASPIAVDAKPTEVQSHNNENRTTNTIPEITASEIIIPTATKNNDSNQVDMTLSDDDFIEDIISTNDAKNGDKSKENMAEEEKIDDIAPTTDSELTIDAIEALLKQYE